MKLSDILNLKTKEGRYLIYLISQYDKLVIGPYVNLFINREGKLEILFNDEFQELKDHVDIAMSQINDLIDTLDINNLDVDKQCMEDIATYIDKLAAYLGYIKDMLNKEDLPF